MIESTLSRQWATLPDFQNRIASWVWFKDAAGECLLLTAQRLNVRCELRNGDLAHGFFQWVGYTDNSQNFARLDPVDYAHYACGVLLRSLIQAHPVFVVDKQVRERAAARSTIDLLTWPEDLVLLCLTLTLLESWRIHLGAPPLVVSMGVIKNHWDSFHENAREDTFSPIAFLDLFLGLPPVWADPMTVSNRPAMWLASKNSHLT